MIVGDLFSGIGGFSLAAEWMGWRTAWFSEIDPFASRVLAHHWPDVPNLGDITRIDWATVPRVDVLTGGFPCQPHSLAGARKASEDSRDLWSECVRALRELRPSHALFENVPGLLTSDGGRFFNRVLSDLAALGYDAEWRVLSAASVGAPHLRERVWITAYANGEQHEGRTHAERRAPESVVSADAEIHRRPECRAQHERRNVDEKSGFVFRCESGGARPSARAKALADTESVSRRARLCSSDARGSGRRFVSDSGGASDAANTVRAGSSRRELSSGARPEHADPRDARWWATEPDVGRVAHGVPARVDRLRCLGNSIVPQCALEIFREIEAREVARSAA